MTAVDMVDISKYQYPPFTSTAPVFDAIPGVGMIHRATDWQTGNQVEAQFPAAWEAMRRFRYRGAYQRMLATVDIDAQADRFLEAVGGRLRVGEFAMLDIETTAGATPTIAQCVRWLQRVETVLGVGRVAVYVGWYALDATGQRFRLSELTDRPWVLPWYGPNYPPTTPTWFLHQWTSSATVAGIASNCDANELLDVAATDRLAGYTGGFVPVVHERDEWLTGYQVAAGEGSAWWGGNTWPGNNAINNLTWHYPGGNVDQSNPAASIRKMQAAYHRRTDGGSNGKPAPFTKGYDLGYNATIDLGGGIWKVRWTDKRCAANGGDANGFSFAIQFMTSRLDDDLTAEQIGAARWLDAHLRSVFPNIPAGVAGHTPHSRWFATSCCGDIIRGHIDAGDLLHRIEPEEDDVTPDELRAAVAAVTDPQFKAIWDLLTKPIAGISADHGMQWNLATLKDYVVDKPHLVDEIVAHLPPAGDGGYTMEQVTDAVQKALREGTG